MPVSLEAEDRTLSLLTTLGAVAEAAVRLDWLRDEWSRTSPAELAAVLEVTVQGADAGLAAYREGLLFFVVSLAPGAFVDLRREAAAQAITQGFFGARSVLVPESRPEPGRPSLGPRAAPGRTLTLGERKSLARAHVRATIEKIALDPHPDVIRILLANPSLREGDVLRLASRRPIPAEILREILLHPRWFVRYGVRLSLVQNPHLPTDLGLALVRQLLRQDALAIAAATELPEVIRSAAVAEANRASPH